MKRVTLIGDSIRHGYQATVIAELADVAEVWGPQQNGGTSANVLEHLDAWVLQRAADVIHMNCGLHDIARLDDNHGEPRIELDAYCRNLRAIFTTITERTDAKLIWCRTTPVNEARHNAVKGFGRFNADIDRYNAAADAIAAELGLLIHDLNAVVIAAGADAIRTPDGVHYTPEGSQLLGKAVADFIRPLL